MVSLLAKRFNKSKFGKGRNHWLVKGQEYKWFLRVTQFLTDLGINVSTKKEIAVVILLIFPAFGPSSTKNAKKSISKSTEVYQLLGDEGVEIYKTSITKNNNEKLRTAFFGTSIVRHLWEKLTPSLTLKDYFGAKGYNKNIFSTYSMISRIMKEVYNLNMSKEWTDAFN